jgi:hypothetical protein
VNPGDKLEALFEIVLEKLFSIAWTRTGIRTLLAHLAAHP